MSETEHLTTDEQFEIIDFYLKQFGVVRHQIEGYNDFIHNLVPAIINNSDPIKVQKEDTVWEYKFTNPIFHPCLTNGNNGKRVMITPNECRINNLSYSSDLQIDIVVTETNIETKHSSSTIFSVIIAKIPIMLKSDLCILNGKTREQCIELQEGVNDPGGYFILRGSEKVLVAQERIASNYPFILESKTGIITVEIRSINETEYRSVLKTELRYYQHSKKNTVIIDKTFRVIFGRMKKDIPLFILLKVLGLNTNEECISFCIPPEISEDEKKKSFELLEPSMEEAFFVNTKESCILFIAKAFGINNLGDINKVSESVYEYIDKELLPHEGITEESRFNKARYLGYMTQKCLLVLKGKRKLDDRDHYGNKRVDNSGHLLANIFRMSFMKLCRTFKVELEKKILNNKSIQLEHELNYNKVPITKDIIFCMGTGNWSVNRQKITKTGVSQVLQRLSFVGTLSFLRKLVTPNSKNGKLAEPRQLHTTSWGYVDPQETPEGQQCGLVKHLSMLCHFNVGVRSEIIRTLCQEKEITGNYTFDYKVFINGVYIGTTDEPQELYTLLKYYKSQGIPSFDMSVIWNKNDKEIRVLTEPGRYCRAVFVVKNKSLVCTRDLLIESKQHNQPFYFLIKKGAIEYIDPLESENTLIAININSIGVDGIDYTHAEIHDTVFMGTTTNCLPFLNHNPAPRITYGCSMQKQSIGLFTTNYQQRTDKSAHVLFYPQKPLVRSHYVDLLHLDQQPAGQVAIVAIACYGG